MTQRIFILLMVALMQASAFAQRTLDFAEKFMTTCEDSTLKCVTISPKMMEQLVKQEAEGKPEPIMQAIAKLKSARIVTGKAELYEKAEQLLKKNKRRFKPEKVYANDEQHGAFFIRKDRKGNTVELIMLQEDPENDKFVIINLTGDIDEEFLCFLYNTNKSLKN
jgi:hypothetical protein